MKRRQHISYSPFGQWLLKQCAERNVSISRLSELAGLSPGTLRHLIIEPERCPSIETCIRLADLFGMSADEVLKIADKEGIGQLPPHPNRLVLLNIYDDLPLKGQDIVLNVAKSLRDMASIAVLNSDEQGD